MTAPLPVCSAKLSIVGSGWYYGGGPRWSPRCCAFATFHHTQLTTYKPRHTQLHTQLHTPCSILLTYFFHLMQHHIYLFYFHMLSLIHVLPWKYRLGVSVLPFCVQVLGSYVLPFLIYTLYTWNTRHWPFSLVYHDTCAPGWLSDTPFDAWNTVSVNCFRCLDCFILYIPISTWYEVCMWKVVRPLLRHCLLSWCHEGEIWLYLDSDTQSRCKVWTLLCPWEW